MKIWFHSKSTGYDWLSNFSRHPFSIDDVMWPTVEHYYQAQKFEDPDLAESIRSIKTPAETRKLADRHAAEIRSDWNGKKDLAMVKALRAKFEQNRKLKKALLTTGEKELIHRSSKDTYWGRNENTNEGRNRLGELLMQIREELADPI